jgi:hypothetical protein
VKEWKYRLIGAIKAGFGLRPKPSRSPAGMDQPIVVSLLPAAVSA